MVNQYLLWLSDHHESILMDSLIVLVCNIFNSSAVFFLFLSLSVEESEREREKVNRIDLFKAITLSKATEHLRSLLPLFRLFYAVAWIFFFLCKTKRRKEEKRTAKQKENEWDRVEMLKLPFAAKSADFNQFTYVE